MRVCIFASGSGGNSLLVSGQDGNVLIDAGISMRKIQAGLQQAGVTMQEINGVLITHEHSDHISGLKMLAKHYNTPIFAPEKLGEKLLELDGNIEKNLNIIPVGKDFDLNGYAVRACHTPHDAVESVAYRLDGDGSFALATDMGHVTDEVRAMLKGVNSAVIESNYDEHMLWNGPYPPFLKYRVGSDRGHLSNDSSAKLAQFLEEHGTGRLVLCHLSRENNTPYRAFSAVKAALHSAATELLCAPAQGFMEIKIG